jgi:hypothetical protein
MIYGVNNNLVMDMPLHFPPNPHLTALKISVVKGLIPVVVYGFNLGVHSGFQDAHDQIVRERERERERESLDNIYSSSTIKCP